MMKCHNTPRRESQNQYATPIPTTVDLGTPRKRIRSRKSPYHVVNTGASNHPKPLSSTRYINRDQTTLRKEKELRSRCNSPSTHSLGQNLDDDVFQATPGTNDMHSSAISQFQDAAKRLALSTVPVNASPESSSRYQSGSRKRRSHTPTSKCRNFSRPTIWRSPPTTPLIRSFVQERDITSAHKESLSKHAHVAKISGSPSFNETIDYQSPTRKGSNLQPYNSLSSATSNSQNFSRPTKHTQSCPLKATTPCMGLLSPAKTETLPSKIPSETGKHHQALQNHHKATSEVLVEASVLGSETTVPETEHGVSGSAQFDPRSGEDQIRLSFDSAVAEDSKDKRTQLKHWEIWLQRIIFASFIFAINIALGLAYLGSHKHPYLLAVLAFMKSKDILSTIADIISLPYRYFHELIWPRSEPRARWILSLVCAYAETEEQIMKTVSSLVTSETKPHRQVICILLDGKPRDILCKMSEVKMKLQRPYTTWRSDPGEICVYSGFIGEIPTLLIEKVENAGKKDSLILGHDLFNYPREDMPQATKLLRQEIWQKMLPTITYGESLEAFDFIFCTDADSTIHTKALCRLADSLCREINAVAACGVLLAEFGGSGTEFSPWHLFQQFQYSFGQYIRRQAESTWGRVTCLPGCITMIAVRPELSDALSEYARPVMDRNIFRHQVQYLGTDRRLTWCMISQNKHLRTIFVPNALSETVVPNSLSHYLSQRRRWASNAYFNDLFYALGPRQRLVTRLFALIDLVRLTLVFYRVFNTAYFIHGLWTNFYVIKIIPTLIVTKTPATWYLILIVWKEPLLRRRLHKVILGMCINQIISPFLSVIVFFNVLFHLGSQSWGKTGVSTQGPPVVLTASASGADKASCLWTPKSLAKTVQKAIRGGRTKQKHKSVTNSPSSNIQSNEAHQSTCERTPNSCANETRITDVCSKLPTPVRHSTSKITPPHIESCGNAFYQSSGAHSHTPFSLLRRTPNRQKCVRKTSKTTSILPSSAEQHEVPFEFDFHE